MQLYTDTSVHFKKSTLYYRQLQSRTVRKVNVELCARSHPVERSPDPSQASQRSDWVNAFSLLYRNVLKAAVRTPPENWNIVLSLFYIHLLLPVLSFQWICCSEEPRISSPAAVPLPFLLGTLGRGRGGGGGGGILQCLPWKKLNEDRVHLATNLLWDEMNREMKKTEVFVLGSPFITLSVHVNHNIPLSLNHWRFAAAF